MNLSHAPRRENAEEIFIFIINKFVGICRLPLPVLGRSAFRSLCTAWARELYNCTCNIHIRLCANTYHELFDVIPNVC